MGSPKSKTDILHEIMGGRMVGGTLSELASYSELFVRMSESVFLLDRQSLRVLECNPSALALLNLKEDAVLGIELPILFSKESVEQNVLKKNLLKFQNRSGFQFSMELEVKDVQSQERFYEVSATTLKILDYIEVVQFIARDVTEVKRAQRELMEMNEALKSLSTTDEMTGLKNYRYLKEVMASVHHQATSFKSSYGVIFLDVDHFKKFNDRNGHPAGDEVLRKVAHILKTTARPQDLACRYGGEEFVVLCRNSSLAEIEVQAELVRNAIAKTVFPFGEFQPLGIVSASIGVASYPECASSWEAVIKNADEALYISKTDGRNRVSSYLEIAKKAA
jgi:diguanylate cyclase (GGDEF)-like protein/PAS domain S-box-containing protein